MILIGLEEYRDYNIIVIVFIRIGEGVKSFFIFKRIEEYGE